jgi:hypothetical protein
MVKGEKSNKQKFQWHLFYIKSRQLGKYCMLENQKFLTLKNCLFEMIQPFSDKNNQG